MCMGGLLHGRCCGPHHRPHRPSPYVFPPHPIFQRIPKENIIVPLTGAAAEVEVVDYCAKVTVKQRYENKESDPVEAVYEFPLHPRASVCEFYAEIDGKKIVGELKEKEKAKDIYDDAIASGHGAYLLEEDKPNHFSCSVGNLPAGKEVIISIVYVMELEFEEGKLKFSLSHLPYPPDGQHTPTFIAPTNPNSPYAKLVNAGLKITVNFDMSSNIKSISSPSHPITFDFGESPAKATVKLANQDNEKIPLLKDFVLSVQLFQPHQPCVRIEEHSSGAKSLMVSLYPDLDREDIQIFTEMVFVVDRSGSMAGSRINSVKETLQIFLRSLPEGTLFNIVGFGTSIVKLFSSGSQEYNDKTLQQAVDHVNDMKANLGGTDILKALMQIFQEQPKEGIPRQIFLLTDGEVSNTQECIDATRKHANTTRVFTFGIGGEASKHLVVGIAKAGEGSFEFIASNDNMDEKVLRQLNKAMKPALTDLSVSWGSLKNVSQTPYYLPPLFGGSRFITYGLLPSNAALEPTDITLHANTAAGKFSTSVVLDPARIQKGNLIYRLLSKSMIRFERVELVLILNRDMEDKRSYLHDKNGNLRNPNTNIKQNILELSLKSGILSSQTAFVAVEERDEATTGEMKLRKINIENLLQDEIQERAESGVKVNTKYVPPSARSGGFGGARGRGGAAPQPALARRSSASSSDRSDSWSDSSRNRDGGSVAQSRSKAPATQKKGFSLFSSKSKEEEKKKSKPKSRSLQSKQVESKKDMDYEENEASSGSDDEDDMLASNMEENSAPVRGSGPPPSAPQQQFQSAPIANNNNSNASTGLSADFKGVIKLQKANGSWPLEALQLVSKNASSDSVLKGISAEAVSKDKATAESIAVSLILCVYFETKLQDQKIHWNLVVKKARTWIKKEADKLGLSSDALEKFAAEYVAQHF